MGHIVNEVIFYFRDLFLFDDSSNSVCERKGDDDDEQTGKPEPHRGFKYNLFSLGGEDQFNVKIFFFPKAREACFVCFFSQGRFYVSCGRVYYGVVFCFHNGKFEIFI